MYCFYWFIICGDGVGNEVFDGVYVVMGGRYYYVDILIVRCRWIFWRYSRDIENNYVYLERS